jgi:hypothetical protein
MVGPGFHINRHHQCRSQIVPEIGHQSERLYFQPLIDDIDASSVGFRIGFVFHQSESCIQRNFHER